MGHMLIEDETLHGNKIARHHFDVVGRSHRLLLPVDNTLAVLSEVNGNHRDAQRVDGFRERQTILCVRTRGTVPEQSAPLGPMQHDDHRCRIHVAGGIHLLRHRQVGDVDRKTIPLGRNGLVIGLRRRVLKRSRRRAIREK